MMWIRGIDQSCMQQLRQGDAKLSPLSSCNVCAGSKLCCQVKLSQQLLSLPNCRQAEESARFVFDIWQMLEGKMGRDTYVQFQFLQSLLVASQAPWLLLISAYCCVGLSLPPACSDGMCLINGGKPYSGTNCRLIGTKF